MGFSGRCEAIKAPTTENDTVQMAKVTIPSSEIKISPRVCSLKIARIKVATASAAHSAHSDQAIQAAVRWLILPALPLGSGSRLSMVAVMPLRPSLLPYLTPLPSLETLRQPLRARSFKMVPLYRGFGKVRIYGDPRSLRFGS